MSGRGKGDDFVRQIEARRGTDSGDKALNQLKPLAADAPVEFERYLRRMGDHRILTRAEEGELSRRAQAGDTRAKQQLVLHNTRLVISICRRYSRLDYEFEDLIQEGIIGLHTAVRKFDPDRGFKFSTYATWWVRQALQRYMQTHGNTIRVPAHIQDTKRKIERYLRDHHGETMADACRELEIEEQAALDAFDGPRVTASLDATIGEDGGDEGRHALIEDKDSPDPLELVMQRGRTGLQRALQELPERQRRVLEMRFGFEGEQKGRDQIARELGITPSAVQSAQKLGLATLSRELGPADGTIEDAGGSGREATAEAVFSSFRRLDGEPPATARCSRKREGE